MLCYSEPCRQALVYLINVMLSSSVFDMSINFIMNTSLIQLMKVQSIIGMFVIKYHLNHRSWRGRAARQPSASSSLTLSIRKSLYLPLIWQGLRDRRFANSKKSQWPKGETADENEWPLSPYTWLYHTGAIHSDWKPSDGAEQDVTIWLRSRLPAL